MKRPAFQLPEFKIDMAEAEGGNPFGGQDDSVPMPISFTPPPAFARTPPSQGGKPPMHQTLPFTPAPVGTSAQDLKPMKLPPGVIDTSTWTGKGTHVTSGLDMNHGSKTAVDIMAKPGTAVAAPANGVVVRLGSAQGGDSMYFRDDEGHMWWLGHIDSRYSLKPGTRVRRGQILSRISADHPAPHLHLDRTL